jgi:hypothetical protein
MQKLTLKYIMRNDKIAHLLNLRDYTKKELNEYIDERNDCPLSYAMQTGHAHYFLFNDEILPLLDLNLTDKQGRTALMWAALFGLYNEIKVMLKNGADWTIKDNEGKTALDFAREYEKSEEEYKPTEGEEAISEEDEEFWGTPTYDIVGILEKPELYTKK